VGALVAVPRGVAARVLRRAFVELDPPYPPGRGTIDDLLTMAGSSHSRTVDVTSLLVARRWGPWLEIARSAETIVPEPSRLVLPGTARWGRFVMDATVVERPVPTPGSVWSLLAPAGATLTIRGAVPGDRIEIVGGHKSVLDALADAGVPKHLRSSWPVVEIDGEVAWVPGVRRAVSAGSRADRYLWATVTEDAAWEPYER
jgi:tRNA(Ile)-lysidine synthetase-like protein